jgi:hypothetical protein
MKNSSLRKETVMTDQTTKTRIATAPVMDEKQYARYKYDQALAAMEKNPTKENVAAFEAANKHLFEVEDSYRIGARLLFERAQNLLSATMGFIRR